MDLDAQLSEKEFQLQKRKKVAMPLMWFGIISIIMLFAGLTSAVIVRKGDGNWLHYEMPSMFLWSTIAITLSSVVLVVATMAAKKDRQPVVKASVVGTMILGLLFVAMQLKGYQQLIGQEVYFTGANHNASGSFLYIISGLHLLHLAGGIIALCVVFFNAFKERYNSKNLLGLQVFSTYWHFLGLMWIYLYVFFKTII
jgi:cytochrome c oxidase subunit 3